MTINATQKHLEGFCTIYPWLEDFASQSGIRSRTIVLDRLEGIGQAHIEIGIEALRILSSRSRISAAVIDTPPQDPSQAPR
jgi:hypothetical protein